MNDDGKMVQDIHNKLRSATVTCYAKHRMPIILSPYRFALVVAMQDVVKV